MGMWQVRSTLMAALLGLAATAPAAPATPPLTFALIGDVPYSDYERQELPRLLAHIGNSGAAFVVHNGDIKNGHSRCDNAMYADILSVFRQSPVPLIYVPGDNEWTDCRRGSNGGYDPLERLQYLRQTFYPDSYALGQQKLRLERQSEQPRPSAVPTSADADCGSPCHPEIHDPRSYRENVRWQLGPVLFVGLNVTGSDNNYGKGTRPNAEFLARNRINQRWLEESFQLAQADMARGVRAVVIIIQANPGFSQPQTGVGNRGYRDFLRQLLDHTRRFAGQVVLVHGDTHHFQINQPLLDPVTRQPLPNFTRVETFGAPFMGWVKGDIDPDRPFPIHFEGHPWPTPPLPSAN